MAAYTWLGTDEDGDITNPDNFDPVGLPGAGDTVSVDGNNVLYPFLTVGTSDADWTIDSIPTVSGVTFNGTVTALNGVEFVNTIFNGDASFTDCYITSGTFNGDVEGDNLYISTGTFNGDVTLSGSNIVNGTFNGDVEVDNTMIEAGTFNGVLSATTESYYYDPIVIGPTGTFIVEFFGAADYTKPFPLEIYGKLVLQSTTLFEQNSPSAKALRAISHSSLGL